jgi:hypothetical protein
MASAQSCATETESEISWKCARFRKQQFIVQDRASELDVFGPLVRRLSQPMKILTRQKVLFWPWRTLFSYSGRAR